MSAVDTDKPIKVHPATAERWPDLEALFGKNGACAGCWCIFWRDRASYKRGKGEGNRAALQALTERPIAPGVLAYADSQVAGWCSVGPREDFKALEGSRILKRVDEEPVWSIVCFFVARPFRGQGAMEALLRGAVAYAAQHGARRVEGFPIDLQTPKLTGQTLTGPSGFMGIASAFRAVGFTEVGRASETQLIMRYTVPHGGETQR